MDEARRVLERLRRIEALERDGAAPRAVLGEIEALLAEVEAWLVVEAAPSDAVQRALERCRSALVPAREVTPRA